MSKTKQRDRLHTRSLFKTPDLQGKGHSVRLRALIPPARQPPPVTAETRCPTAPETTPLPASGPVLPRHLPCISPCPAHRTHPPLS